MSSSQRFFQVAKRLLSAPEMSLGGGKIEELPAKALIEGGEVKPGGLAWYGVQTTPLEGPRTSEQVVLFDEGVKAGLIQHVARLALKEMDSERVICVVPDGADDLAKVDSSGRVSVWSAKRFFEHILRLPVDFFSQLRRVAEIERPEEFGVAFQERRAIPFNRSGGESMDIVEFFSSWLANHYRVTPILLLGERGLGKSWQSLRLAREAYSRHLQDPWGYGPAFFVKLRELVDLVEESSAATPVLLRYIFSRYADLRFGLGGVASLGALISIGHTVVCVDGFDEMDIVPTDARVRARLTELLMILSRKTRFILSCRPGHFRSIEALLATESWSGVSVGEAFEVLELLPYDDPRWSSYIDATAPELSATLSELIGGERDEKRGPLEHALWVCATQPGMLARIKDKMQSGGIRDRRVLIEDAVTSVRIDHNLREGRTRRNYQVADGSWVELSAERREEILADIAWYLGERGLEELDLAALPPRIRLSYRIEDDALQRDLRSQTVLEPVPLPSKERDSSNGSEWVGIEASESPVGQDTSQEKSPVRFTLRDDAWPEDEPGEVSVAWSYYLSKYIETRFSDAGPFGPLPSEVRFRYLGKIPLGPTVAAMLGEMLEEKGISVKRLGEMGSSFLAEEARNKDYRIFSPWYRHLAANLSRLGALDRGSAELLDPWSPEVLKIVRQPTALRDYELAVVPPESRTGGKAPFLLGVHEVTNRQYLAFVQSVPEQGMDQIVAGPEWAVERMTVAAGRRGEALSPNHVLSNEYHLFFWLPERGEDPWIDGEEERSRDFHPPAGTLGRPVTYISWYASAAYCDWLSASEGLPRTYHRLLQQALEVEGTGEDCGAELPPLGYRLPTREEWVWAARGGHRDVNRAWDLYPYHLSSEERTRLLSTIREGVGKTSAVTRYLEARRVMRAILLDPYKQSGDVVHDEPNDFGVAGLIGNVREWCHSGPSQQAGRADASSDQRLILGATGYLGESTFNFEYEAPLYPRNTNPDVGFRIARTMSPSEVEVLETRQDAIARLEADG